MASWRRYRWIWQNPLLIVVLIIFTVSQVYIKYKRSHLYINKTPKKIEHFWKPKVIFENPFLNFVEDSFKLNEEVTPAFVLQSASVTSCNYSLELPELSDEIGKVSSKIFFLETSGRKSLNPRQAS